MERRLRDAVGLPRVSLGMPTEILDPIDMIAPILGPPGVVVDPPVAIPLEARRVVDGVGVEVDHAVRCHLPLDVRQDGLTVGVADHLGKHLATAPQDAEDRELPRGTPAALASPAGRAEVAHIDLDLAVERLGPLPLLVPRDRPAETVEGGRDGVAVQAGQVGGRPGGDTGDESPHQFLDLIVG